VKPVLLDTGVIVALLDSSDSFHQRCANIMAELRAPLVTCEAVIAESCYLLRNVKGTAEVILESVAAREFLIPQGLGDIVGDLRLIFHKYRDRKIDLADAILVQLATEFRTGDILTLDRDFHIYRWGRNNAFNMLVPLN
jgi:uncharacterized protein